MSHRSTVLTSALAVTALSIAACGGPTDDASGDATAETTTATSQTSTAASAPGTESSAASQPAGSEDRASQTSASQTNDVAAAAAPAAGQANSPFTLEDTHLETPGYSDLKIEGIRAGSHDGYDRVVVDFSGTGQPNVLAGYNADPRQQASGYPLVPAGNAYFDLIIQGVPQSMSLDEADIAKSDPAGVAAGGIAEIADGGVFEANAQYVIGLDAKRPYHLYMLDNPTRLVVDFQK
ncbi:AMIN-like domain-containing (lipo)protein [Corynebacterium fournieri]|uniref:AMIN-like domain-containing (lipo)protein n=1 Tax=Corynebacterium fournieri TaxID=1852390 RepID=UPI0011776D20|nr:hypothetical protein [Corynebacterium fournieri]WJY97781.1 hypothetical protein CFOUR_06870 [Corynebacterium fournieri]